jgi:hypothetical protein
LEARKQLMIYEVVHDISHEKIVERVNGKIGEGWEPVGGISVCPDMDLDTREPTGHLSYSQALVYKA